MIGFEGQERPQMNRTLNNAAGVNNAANPLPGAVGGAATGRKSK
jgi:hypothetical protein